MLVANKTLNLLTGQFGDKVVSRNGMVPPRCRDCTPSEYFHWEFVKSKVYANNATTVEARAVHIRGTIYEQVK